MQHCSLVDGSIGQDGLILAGLESSEKSDIVLLYQDGSDEAGTIAMCSPSQQYFATMSIVKAMRLVSEGWGCVWNLVHN